VSVGSASLVPVAFLAGGAVLAAMGFGRLMDSSHLTAWMAAVYGAR
jgi:hypothetical protein